MTTVLNCIALVLGLIGLVGMINDTHYWIFFYGGAFVALEIAYQTTPAHVKLRRKLGLTPYSFVLLSFIFVSGVVAWSDPSWMY